MSFQAIEEQFFIPAAVGEVNSALSRVAASGVNVALVDRGKEGFEFNPVVSREDPTKTVPGQIAAIPYQNGTALFVLAESKNAHERAVAMMASAAITHDLGKELGQPVELVRIARVPLEIEAADSQLAPL